MKTPNTNGDALRACIAYTIGIASVVALIPLATTPFGEILTWHTLSQAASSFGIVVGLSAAVLLTGVTMTLAFRTVAGRYL